MLTGAGKIGACCIQNRSFLGASVHHQMNITLLFFIRRVVELICVPLAARGVLQVPRQWHCSVTQPLLALLLHKALLALSRALCDCRSNSHRLTALGGTVCVPRLVLGQEIQADRLWAHGQHKQIH